MIREYEAHKSKGTIMENIATEIKACRKCDLWKQRQNVVPAKAVPTLS